MDRRIAAALVCTLALGTASCGSTEAKLTREQLVAKMQLACRQAATATAQQQSRSGIGTTSSPDHAALGAAMLAGQQVLEDRLADLNPPDAAKQDFEAFRKGIQQRLDLYERMEAEFRSGAQTASNELQQQNLALFHRLDDIAHRLELAGCI
jgi:hypothetical protein